MAMRQLTEHREAVADARALGRREARVPAEHRGALAAEFERLRAERERLRSGLKVHREALEHVREQLSRERTYHRRAYQQNRWWIELALKWWEARRAA
jgi:tRNA pseudouridine-54 N-methylase